MTQETAFSFLVINNDATLRETFSDALFRHYPGAEVREARDGAEGLDLVQKHAFTVVISDLDVPKLDGRSLAYALRNIPEERRPKHLIVISGYADGESATQELGRVSYLPKPIQGDALTAYIDKLLYRDDPLIEEKVLSSGGKRDIAWVKPFVTAAVSVISVLASTEVKQEKVFMRKPGEASGDISAVIALNNEKLSASLAITFPEKVFLAIVGRMLGDDLKEMKVVNSAAGEICNQICGGAKPGLAAMGYKFPFSIPTIISGQNHAIKHLVNGPCVAVQFATEFGPFLIEVVIKERPDEQVFGA